MKGTLPALLALSILLVLTGCVTNGGGGLCVGGIVEKLDTGTIFILIAVLEGSSSGAPVDDATLTINGTPIAGAGGLFMDLGSVAINDGANVLLEVEGGGSIVTTTVAMPEKPVITLPTEDLTVVGAVNASWTSISDPNTFIISVLDAYSAVGDYAHTVSGGVRGYSMVGVFDTGVAGKSYFDLSAANQATSFTGDSANDSEFAVLNTTESPGFYVD
jgi:hypothetical protein